MDDGHNIFLLDLADESCEAQRAKAKKYFAKKFFLTIVIFKAGLQVKESPRSDEGHGRPKPVG